MSWYGPVNCLSGREPVTRLFVLVHKFADCATAMIYCDESTTGPAEILVVLPAQRRSRLRPEFVFEFLSFVRFLGAVDAGAELHVHDAITAAIAETRGSDSLIFSISSGLWPSMNRRPQIRYAECLKEIPANTVVARHHGRRDCFELPLIVYWKRLVVASRQIGRPENRPRCVHAWDSSDTVEVHCEKVLRPESALASMSFAKLLISRLGARVHTLECLHIFENQGHREVDPPSTIALVSMKIASAESAQSSPSENSATTSNLPDGAPVFRS